jgi:hypothetical protein
LFLAKVSPEFVCNTANTLWSSFAGKILDRVNKNEVVVLDPNKFQVKSIKEVL